jgi:hypothetical protein
VDVTLAHVAGKAGNGLINQNNANLNLSTFSNYGGKVTFDSASATNPVATPCYVRLDNEGGDFEFSKGSFVQITHLFNTGMGQSNMWEIRNNTPDSLINMYDGAKVYADANRNVALNAGNFNVVGSAGLATPFTDYLRGARLDVEGGKLTLGSAANTGAYATLDLGDDTTVFGDLYLEHGSITTHAGFQTGPKGNDSISCNNVNVNSDGALKDGTWTLACYDAPVAAGNTIDEVKFTGTVTTAGRRSPGPAPSPSPPPRPPPGGNGP